MHNACTPGAHSRLAPAPRHSRHPAGTASRACAGRTFTTSRPWPTTSWARCRRAASWGCTPRPRTPTCQPSTTVRAGAAGQVDCRARRVGCSIAAAWPHRCQQVSHDSSTVHMSLPGAGGHASHGFPHASAPPARLPPPALPAELPSVAPESHGALRAQEQRLQWTQSSSATAEVGRGVMAGLVMAQDLQPWGAAQVFAGRRMTCSHRAGSPTGVKIKPRSGPHKACSTSAGRGRPCVRGRMRS